MQAEPRQMSLLDATIAAAEDGRFGGTLWSGDAGEALADALARLRAAWAGKSAIAGGEWPALLATMLEPEIVRPSFGRHPRLAIWGPLEGSPAARRPPWCWAG
jgi:ATP-dependent helicase/nuclease subunit B